MSVILPSNFQSSNVAVFAVDETVATIERIQETEQLMIPERYLNLAMSARKNDVLEDGSCFIEIPGFEGLYGAGPDELSATLDLRYALADWILVKITNGDGDLPIIDDINLNPRQ